MRSTIRVLALVVCLSVGVNASAAGITVNNPGFETPALGPPSYTIDAGSSTFFADTGWNATYYSRGTPLWAIGIYNISEYAYLYPGGTPDGPQIAWIYGYYGILWQQTGKTLESGETYTVTAWAGQRSEYEINPFTPPWIPRDPASPWIDICNPFAPSWIRLFAGDDVLSGTLLKSVAVATVPEPGTFVGQTLTFGPSDADYASLLAAAEHQNLIVALYSEGDVPDPNTWLETDWDAVSFSYTPAWVLGDMDGSDAVNNNDIAPFVTALTNREQYLIDYPDIDPDAVGDIDGDGTLNNNDITPFVTLLTSGGAGVPEPATVAVLLTGLLALSHRRRKVAPRRELAPGKSASR